MQILYLLLLLYLSILNQILTRNRDSSYFIKTDNKLLRIAKLPKVVSFYCLAGGEVNAKAIES